MTWSTPLGRFWSPRRRDAAGRGRGHWRKRLAAEPLEPRQMLAGIVPDFALVDVNSTSETYNQEVSPRDYLGEVSGFYFARAT